MPGSPVLPPADASESSHTEVALEQAVAPTHETVDVEATVAEPAGGISEDSVSEEAMDPDHRGAEHNQESIAVPVQQAADVPELPSEVRVEAAFEAEQITEDLVSDDENESLDMESVLSLIHI